MAVPTGYSGASGIAMIRLRTGEKTLPVDTDILTLMNAGIEQIEARLGAVKLFASYPTIPGQNVILLNDDIQDIISASWSNTDPTSAGGMVYNVQPLEQQKFMDVAGGFPATGAGPPIAYFLTQDFASGLLIPPPAAILSSQAGVSAGGTVYVVVTYVNGGGETTQSVLNSIYLIPSLAALVGSPPDNENDDTIVGYNVYASFSAQGPFYLQNGSPVPIGTNFVLPSPLLAVTPSPETNTATGYSSGGQLTMQLYPPPMLGQMNLYYRGRPQLWADTSSQSWTNVDTMAQESCILWGMMRVLENRGRGDEAAQLYKPQYDETMSMLEEQIRRRTTPRSGQVRDVRGYVWQPFPSYWRQ